MENQGHFFSVLILLDCCLGSCVSVSKVFIFTFLPWCSLFRTVSSNGEVITPPGTPELMHPFPVYLCWININTSLFIFSLFRKSCGKCLILMEYIVILLAILLHKHHISVFRLLYNIQVPVTILTSQSHYMTPRGGAYQMNEGKVKGS